jgi:ribose/xylose/arabinose/galactoside ABC-type transport system permease subunit
MRSTSDAATPRFSPRELLSRREYGVLALLMLVVLGVSLFNPAFLQPGNLRDILVQAAPVVIIACGLTFVVVLGEIDISVGSLMGLLATVLGVLTTRQGWPASTAIVATLALGAAVGLLNGALVTFGRVPSIIVTLGMLTALRGVTELLLGGEIVNNLPAALRVWGTGAVLGVPISIVVAAVVVALAVLFARETPLGRRIYAAGSNPHAAKLAGLRLNTLKLFVFTLTGLLTGVATLVSAPQLDVIEAGFGRGMELLVVTSVVVGGTAISGGRGTIAGSVLAAILLSMIGTALIFLRLGESATYWERAIQGAFILLAVLADHVARRGKPGGVAA